MTAGSARPGLHLLLVDDHTTVRAGLKHILTRGDADWTVAEASSGFGALEALRRERFDLAIVDLSMPGMNGLDLIARVRAEFGQLPLLVLTMHAEDAYALRAFKAGANGYLTKDSAADELIQAVLKVAGGGAYVSAALAERVVMQLNRPADEPPHACLTAREFEVLQRLVAGHRPIDIGRALHLSHKTISSHKTRIMAKLKLDSTAALIRYGLTHGLHADVLPGDVADRPAGWTTDSGLGELP
jgi:DNA-binding NarL/FixJ family response regulator